MSMACYTLTQYTFKKYHINLWSAQTLPFPSVGTEFTDVQPGQGSQASAMREEMNFDYPYSWVKELHQTILYWKHCFVFLNWRLYYQDIFPLLFCSAYYKTESRTEIADCLKSKWQYLYQKCWQPAVQMGFCTAIFKTGALRITPPTAPMLKDDSSQRAYYSTLSSAPSF